MKQTITQYSLFHSFTSKWLMLLICFGVFSLKSLADNLSREAGGLSSTIKATKPAIFASQQVGSFTLINADNGQPIQTLTGGTALNLATLPTKNLNIRANTSPGIVGSVKFALRGKQTVNKTETRVPYALFGETKDNYNAWVPALGSYTLKATPFSEAGGTGVAGIAFSVSFTVISNQLPKANAGADKTIILPTTTTVLNGSGTDADGTITGYSWSQVSGPNTATFNNKTIAAPTIGNLIQGSYIFSLQVKDSLNMWSAADNVTVQITTSNSPPSVVQKPTDQTLVTEKIFSFSAGQYTDPNAGDVLTYKSNLIDGSNLLAWLQFNASTLTFSGTAPAPETTLHVQVTATDQAKASVTTSFKISVQKPVPVVILGELKKWHKVTLTFTGPVTSETNAVNPFLNYRLNVIFSKGNRKLIVPGYYAADGNAGETDATGGAKWRVHFSPDEAGEWSYQASFRTGTNVAISNLANAGSPAVFDGMSGTFTIAATDKTGSDFRAQGRLRYVGQHYLQFAETKKYFLKGGADSPENFLAYKEFDGTYTQNPQADYTKTYAPHLGDWQPGDPVWKGGKGKGIIGALNYLAEKGMNAVYFLTLNVNGDGKDVWPWISPIDKIRYDVSKLDQWEIVFSHMDKLGLMLHVVTQEQENDQLLDNGELGTQRKLYYRELIARFGHHLAINWNLGEESSNTDAQRKAFSHYIRQLDPYKSPIDVHTHPTQRAAIYKPLLGDSTFEGPSLQVVNAADAHSETLYWVNKSAASGRKWIVNLDEIGPSTTGVKPDANDYAHDSPRKQALWGNLMAGGGGVEWYFGYRFLNSDISAQDWRSRDHMWDLTRYALQFFNQYLPFWQMKSADNLTTATNDYCLALPGKIYAVYLPQGGSTTLDFGVNADNYLVQWYNPRTGGNLQNGTVQKITGSGLNSLGLPPQNDTQDWVCLITNTSSLHNEGITQSKNVTPATKNANAKLAFSVYPNPIQHKLIIETKEPVSLPLEIILRNNAGKTVATTFLSNAVKEPLTLDTYGLTPGIYLLQIKYGNQIISRKLIKQ
ncbi:PKD domain-containing protein [Adhaeribacter radiodurans]|uniref:DUF5060 domain-containing protein n=1 Tax=Adhaeribacter radiodurans TaxID=2745197 RepID=A0A7L7L899_9BACT|nr:DUF5060 domain-containing protein [Adhaeribacter radiodurans]QMU29027.1 DUF5060 domain-containing protein [Adhaeribacter radiodurans]